MALVRQTFAIKVAPLKVCEYVGESLAGINLPLELAFLAILSQNKHWAYSAHCKNLMKIFQSQKTRQMKWAWNCSVLLLTLAKMQIFKANFQPDGRKMQKNFISKSFLKRLKKFANVGSLAEGWRLKKLFRFL